MKKYNYIKFFIIGLLVCICGYTYSMGVFKSDGSDEIIEYNASETYTTELSETEEITTVVKETEDIYVQVCGAVNTPGVYKVQNKTRVYQVIELAGGLCDDADAGGINQAVTVSDGEQIYVPVIGENPISNSNDNGKVSDNTSEEGRININTASKQELLSLPGIGEAKADSIIAYRENNGLFTTIEDIMNVSGIKEAAFNKIKELIFV